MNSDIQSGAAGCEKGLVKCFQKVSLASLGSMGAAVQPNGLWNSRKIFYKTFFTTSRPRLYKAKQDQGTMAIDLSKVQFLFLKNVLA